MIHHQWTCALVCVPIYSGNQTWAYPRRVPLNPKGRETYPLFPHQLVPITALAKHGSGGNEEKKRMTNII